MQQVVNFPSFHIKLESAVLPVECYFLDRKMPPKKKNNKKKQCNGFYMYMMDKKRGFEIECGKDLTMPEMVSLAHPGWKVGLNFFLKDQPSISQNSS